MPDRGSVTLGGERLIPRPKLHTPNAKLHTAKQVLHRGTIAAPRQTLPPPRDVPRGGGATSSSPQTPNPSIQTQNIRRFYIEVRSPLKVKPCPIAEACLGGHLDAACADGFMGKDCG